MDLMAVNDVL